MSENVWYVAVGSKQYGPYSVQDVSQRARNGLVKEDTLLFGPGLTQWTAARNVPAFTAIFGAPAAPPAPPAAPASADEIEFQIRGEEMQFVEVTLDPGESAVAEPGSMMFMTDAIQMNTVFGDGTGQDGSFMNKLVGAGKRLLAGESLSMTVFTNAGGGKHTVAFAAPYPGSIVPLDLRQLGGSVVCQKDSFLCAAKGVSIGIEFQKKLSVGFFGGEGFIMQKLEGNGLAFAHAGGAVTTMSLPAGGSVRVDTGCIVALERSVTYDVEFVGGFKNVLFGGEGLFFATLRGPGRVWLQSLPFSRLAGRIFAAMPRAGGSQVGEGSLLGGILMGPR